MKAEKTGLKIISSLKSLMRFSKSKKQTRTENEIIDVFEKHRLMLGRMISGSKSGYCQKYPKHDVRFNANIFIPSTGKVWFGDLDITVDNKKLQDVCNELDEEMIVVPEMMGRFGAEEEPYKKIFEHAHTRFTPNAVEYDERLYEGFKIVTVDKLRIVTSKGVSWIKRKVRKK